MQNKFRANEESEDARKDLHKEVVERILFTAFALEE